jgi:hypothetical protein
MNNIYERNLKAATFLVKSKPEYFSIIKTNSNSYLIEFGGIEVGINDVVKAPLVTWDITTGKQL